MGKSINRLLAELIDDDGDVQSEYLDNVEASGLVYYETLDSLPVGNALSAGNLAYVAANQRMYVSNGVGWYNAGLINRSPRWQTEPSATYEIVDSATPLTITAKAVDSDNSNLTLVNQSFGSDSAQYKLDVSVDSSVFTFTPKTAAAVGSAVAAGNIPDSNGDVNYTFKWSDGIGFVSKLVTLQYAPGGGAPLQWANSNSDPYIMWTDPTDFSKRRFAYPINWPSQTPGTWRYALNYPSSPSNFSNQGLVVTVPQGVEWNGTVYTAYALSNQWTGGNYNYEIWNTGVSSPSYTNESTAGSNNAGNIPL
tara:strand:+ start:10619 stop:11542 length:924 start_codon:yes stop_codon:yes gene_type:complete